MTQEFPAPKHYDNQSWYADSGASHHVTPEPHNLTQGAPYSGTDQVHMGNGQGLVISSLGSAKFSSPYNSNTILSLNNLLLVPHITKNLVSVSQFARDNNVFFDFHPHSCFVKSQVSRQVLLKGNLGHDGLYRFDNIHLLKSPCSASNLSPMSSFMNSNNTAVLNTVVAPSSTFGLWHSRLGHAHSNSVKAVLDLCKIPYQSKGILDLCVACCLGKSHRLHAPSSPRVYHTPFELVYCDLWGPAPFISSNG